MRVGIYDFGTRVKQQQKSEITASRESLLPTAHMSQTISSLIGVFSKAEGKGVGNRRAGKYLAIKIWSPKNKL